MSPDRRYATGIACIVGSALAFGALAILARVAYASGVDPTTLLALRFAIAAGAMLLISLANRSARSHACSAMLASTVAAITLYFAGLARIGPTRASTLSTIEPAFTVLLASLVLGERIETLQVVGGGLILVAVVMLAHVLPQATRPRRARTRRLDGLVVGEREVVAIFVFSIYFTIHDRTLNPTPASIGGLRIMINSSFPNPPPGCTS